MYGTRQVMPTIKLKVLKQKAVSRMNTGAAGSPKVSSDLSTEDGVDKMFEKHHRSCAIGILVPCETRDHFLDGGSIILLFQLTVSDLSSLTNFTANHARRRGRIDQATSL